MNYNIGAINSQEVSTTKDPCMDLSLPRIHTSQDIGREELFNKNKLRHVPDKNLSGPIDNGIISIVRYSVYPIDLVDDEGDSLPPAQYSMEVGLTLQPELRFIEESTGRIVRCTQFESGEVYTHISDQVGGGLQVSPRNVARETLRGPDPRYPSTPPGVKRPSSPPRAPGKPFEANQTLKVPKLEKPQSTPGFSIPVRGVKGIRSVDSTTTLQSAFPHLEGKGYFKAGGKIVEWHTPLSRHLTLDGPITQDNNLTFNGLVVGGSDAIPSACGFNPLSKESRFQQFIRYCTENDSEDHYVLRMGSHDFRIPRIPVSEIPSFVASWIDGPFAITVENMALDLFIQLAVGTLITVSGRLLGGKRGPPETKKKEKEKPKHSSSQVIVSPKKRLPIVDAAVAYRYSLAHPFAGNPQRLPDAWQHPTIVGRLETACTITADATGVVSFVVFPNAFATIFMIQGTMTSAGGMLNNGSVYAMVAPAKLTGYGNVRVTTGGIAVTSTQNSQTVTGQAYVAVVPCLDVAVMPDTFVGSTSIATQQGLLNMIRNTTGISGINANLMTQAFGHTYQMTDVVEKTGTANFIPYTESAHLFRPVDKYLALYNAASNMGEAVYAVTAGTTITPSGAQMTNCSGQSAILVYADGLAPSALAMRLRVCLNIEGTPQTSQSGTDGLTPAVAGSEPDSLVGSGLIVEKAIQNAVRDPQSILAIAEKAIDTAVKYGPYVTKFMDWMEHWGGLFA